MTNQDCDALLIDSLPTHGWLTEPEARLLLRSARQALCITSEPGCKRMILEVGCYHGRSTVLLASLGHQVVSVDPFHSFDSDDPTGKQTLRAFLQNLESRNIDNVELVSCKIEEFTDCYDGPYDHFVFAYLDGDHTFQGTLNQIDTALDLGISVMCIHDYAEEGGGKYIKEAIEESRLTIAERVGTMVRCVASAAPE